MKTNRRSVIPGASVLVMAILCVLSSCPNPLSPQMVTQVKDQISPQITIVSPAEGS